VQSPVAIQFIEPNLVFIVNMATSHARLDTKYEVEPSPEIPHLIYGGHLKYGSNDFVALSKFTIPSDGKMVCIELGFVLESQRGLHGRKRTRR
jgi:hypothetical protein